MKTFLQQVKERDLEELLDRARAPHKATAEEVGGKGRERHVSRARAAFVVALRDLGWSSVAIGRLLERDTSSVFYLERVGRAAAAASAPGAP
jgi:chromosomal replication initiation ATPase DnaA